MESKILLVCKCEKEKIIKKLDYCFCDDYDEAPCPVCKRLYKNLTDIEDLIDYYKLKQNTKNSNLFEPLEKVNKERYE